MIWLPFSSLFPSNPYYSKRTFVFPYTPNARFLPLFSPLKSRQTPHDLPASFISPILSLSPDFSRFLAFSGRAFARPPETMV